MSARLILFALALTLALGCGEDDSETPLDRTGTSGAGGELESTTGGASDGNGGAPSTSGGIAGDSGTAGDTSTAGDSGAAGSGSDDGPSAILFLPDSLNDIVHRLRIRPDAEPEPLEPIPAELASGVSVTPEGELFVGEYSAAAPLKRFLSPLGEPEEQPALEELGLHFPQAMSLVDDELWVMNTADHACTSETQSIVRLAVDGGDVTVAGTVEDGLIGANRGMLWVPETRTLYVSQCYPLTAIRRYLVATDHEVTALGTFEGPMNPHGMVLTPGGDLLIAEAGVPSGSHTLSRFVLDTGGATTPAGEVESELISTPVGLVMAPWNELYVINQGDASLGRFTFDADDEPVENGRYSLNVATEVTRFGLGWGAIVAEPD